jgi:hypothetical protein
MLLYTSAETLTSDSIVNVLFYCRAPTGPPTGRRGRTVESFYTELPGIWWFGRMSH